MGKLLKGLFTKEGDYDKNEFGKLCFRLTKNYWKHLNV